MASQVEDLITNLGEEGALLACAITDTVKQASVLTSTSAGSEEHIGNEEQSKKDTLVVDKTLERNSLWCPNAASSPF